MIFFVFITRCSIWGCTYQQNCNEVINGDSTLLLDVRSHQNFSSNPSKHKLVACLELDVSKYLPIRYSLRKLRNLGQRVLGTELVMHSRVEDVLAADLREHFVVDQGQLSSDFSWVQIDKVQLRHIFLYLVTHYSLVK